MGAVRHHGRKGSGGRPARQTALQTRPLAQQSPPLSQPSGKIKKTYKQNEMPAVLLHLCLCTCLFMPNEKPAVLLYSVFVLVLTLLLHLHLSDWTWFSLCVFPSQYKADLINAFSHQVLPHFSEQVASLRPVIDSTFNLENIAEAHRYMEANKNMGKIVINVIPQNQETRWWTAVVICHHSEVLFFMPRNVPHNLVFLYCWSLF